jgi:hypothetical protein
VLPIQASLGARPMKAFKQKSQQQAKSEEGMALIITLMMGLMLLAGSSGLLARMTMSRKLGASESYQQMAETAALNGFNRILATLNNDDDEKYRGYYFNLDNKEGEPDIQGDENLEWDTANNDPKPRPLEELCLVRGPRLRGDYWQRRTLRGRPADRLGGFGVPWTMNSCKVCGD